jgi:hypothetical protein
MMELGGAMEIVDPVATLRRDAFRRLEIAFWSYLAAFAALIAIDLNKVPTALALTIIGVFLLAWIAFLATAWLLASSFKKSPVYYVLVWILLGPLGMIVTYLRIKQLG